MEIGINRYLNSNTKRWFNYQDMYQTFKNIISKLLKINAKCVGLMINLEPALLVDFGVWLLFKSKFTFNSVNH